ncbi:hypothetical protein Pcac1_g24883 [Phytophthora cactorum]|nr:hypothetical protein Pcac1_g24883 [Phytophthora cactorum]
MDLLEAICKEVLKQKEEEALNFFSTVSDFREFITTAKPATDVSVTVKMTYWMSEWVNGDHGTRVTLIDANQRAFFDSTVEALGELTVVKRKPYIAQIMVWDDKANKGVSGFGSKPGMMFSGLPVGDMTGLRHVGARNCRGCRPSAGMFKKTSLRARRYAKGSSRSLLVQRKW